MHINRCFLHLHLSLCAISMVQIHLLRHARNLMVIGGVWRQTIFKNPKIEKLYYAYAYFFQSFYITTCFLMFIEFFYFLGAEDVDQLTENIKMTISCSLAALKFLIFQNGYIPELIAQMIKEEMNILSSEDREIKSIYFGFINYINKSSIAILALSNGTAIFRVIATLIRGFITQRNNNAFPKPMIFLAHFPFNQDVHYETSLILQSFAIALACVYYCISQILYITILIFAKAQIKILQHYFRKFDYYVMINRPVLKESDVVKMLIKRHQFIIRCFVGRAKPLYYRLQHDVRVLKQQFE
nr:odorant receptor 39 [Pachyrhinus yasumatsui]